MTAGTEFKSVNAKPYNTHYQYHSNSIVYRITCTFSWSNDVVIPNGTDEGHDSINSS